MANVRRHSRADFRPSHRNQDVRLSDVFQELQEEHRRQQLSDLWKKIQIPVIGAAVVAVLAVGGYQYWTYWRGEQALASSRAFDAAMREIEADNAKGAIERFQKLGDKAVGGYALLARLQEAALYGRTGEVDKAVKIYEQVARDESDPLFSGLAIMRAALLTVETASFEDTRKRLDPLAAKVGPWQAGAIELLAYANWRDGKGAEALKLYAQVLAMPDAPEKLKRRAEEMKALLDGGLTFDAMNKRVISSAPGRPLLPFGLDPSAPLVPGSLFGPEVPEPSVPAAPAETPVPSP
jgi:hypothetical protein